MPVISIGYRDMVSLLGMEVPKEELVERLPTLGCVVERVEGDTLDVEFFPNRPDLYSVEGVARALRAFLGFRPGLPEYPAAPSGEVLTVDESVEKVRPYILLARVYGVQMSDALIRSLMDIQEKLHLTLGRKRRKVAIGVHDADRVKGPYRYAAVEPASVRFVPLGHTEPVGMDEILRVHEKGREYAHILSGAKRWPLITDGGEQVLSFPPIINGALTAIGPATRNILIDVTGTEMRAVGQTLTILATLLAERGGRIGTIEVRYPGGSVTSPPLEPGVKEVSLGYANSLLGLDLGPEEACRLMSLMMYGAEHHGKGRTCTISARYPAFRADILHPVDLVEDIGIAYGFRALNPLLPGAVTFGLPLPSEELRERLVKVMLGLGFTETATLHISGEAEQFGKMRMPADGAGGAAVRIKNPMMEEYTLIRPSLLPSLLAVLSVNRRRELPQRMFEVGDVVLEGENRRFLACAAEHSRASFTEMKSVVEAVLREAGAEHSLVPADHPSFLPGRCAGVVVGGRRAGLFGEVHPEVLERFELGAPVIVMELDTAIFIRPVQDMQKP